MTAVNPLAGGYPLAPNLTKGGLVVYADPASSNPTNVIAFQYNADTLTRGLTPQTEPNPRQNAGDTQHALPPLETYSLAVELDAADQLQVLDQVIVQSGLHPALAALELLMYPASSVLQQQDQMYSQGASLIQPGRIPLVVFVWGHNRVIPVRVTSLSITEQAFDKKLNPIRAKVDLRLTSLTNQELQRAGGSFTKLALTHLRQKEQMSRQDLVSARLRAKVPF